MLSAQEIFLRLTLAAAPGAILREAGGVVGMTTAATVFVEAAIGMAAGGGLYAVAAYATGLVLFGLIVIGWSADRINLKRRIMVLRITASQADDVATEVQQLLVGMKVTIRHLRTSMMGINSIVELEADVSHSQQQRYRYRGDSVRGPSRMTRSNGTPRKPRALAAGSRLGVFAPASPAESVEMIAGLAELKRHGFQVVANQDTKAEGYFAGPPLERANSFLGTLNSERVDGLVALRGGYGSNYLLEFELEKSLANLKCVIGFSDLTTLQIFLWQRCNWITFYGPMVAAGLNAGPGARKGYDESSFLQAVGRTEGGWKLRLRGEPVLAAQSMGRVLGGCMTLLEATIGKPWELDTKDSILVLENRAMRPYQVDLVLMHLKQAGKFEGVRGIVLGDFPESEPAVPGAPSVREVCARILRPLGVPIVFGAPIGHTVRPMLTIPLGIQARLDAHGEGTLEFLESAVVA